MEAPEGDGDVSGGGLPSARPASPAPSISLLEVKVETSLVLEAFLRRALSTPLTQRPGSIGGSYRDHKNCIASPKDDRVRAEVSKDDRVRAEVSKDGRSRVEGSKDGRPRAEGSKDGSSTTEGPEDGRCKAEGGLDSQSCSEAEKKLKFKGLLKKHLKARSFKLHLRDSQKTDSRLQEDVVSPYSSTTDDESDGEEENKKKKKKKKKLKLPFSNIFHNMKSKKDTANKDVSNPEGPSSLVTSDTKTDPAEPLTSPGHPPEFYAEVAESIDRFAMKHSLETQEHSLAGSANSKEAVVQQLVQALQIQGDAINDRIQSSPFVRSSLTKISYRSFANLVDMFTSQTRAPAPAPTSPTLSRIAMTMEVSRRVVTATGTLKIQEHAERYMEEFTPWVRSHGGWENILQSEEVLEYDWQD
ncbi:uncharacterized protein LOC135244059 [Anguilla rostrata]|uniref:uncharacterized protein LOC135244059 n=1 Tax=Anguilla rostrata TaxID=7938 RepID=UPI0030D48D34